MKVNNHKEKLREAICKEFKRLIKKHPEDNLISLSEFKHEPTPYTEEQKDRLRPFYVNGRVVYDESIIKVLHGECKKEKKRNEYKR